MNIPLITPWLARAKQNRELDKTCKRTLTREASKKRRHHYDSSTDPVVMEVRG